MKIEFIQLNKDAYSTAYKFILDSVDEFTCMNMELESVLHQTDGTFDLSFKLINNMLKFEISDDLVKFVNFTSDCKIPNTEFCAIQIF